MHDDLCVFVENGMFCSPGEEMQGVVGVLSLCILIQQKYTETRHCRHDKKEIEAILSKLYYNPSVIKPLWADSFVFISKC